MTQLKVSREEVRRRTARGLGLRGDAEWTDIYRTIDALPEDGMVHPQDIRDQIARDLDGQMPAF